MILNIVEEEKKLSFELQHWFDSLKVHLNDVPNQLYHQLKLLEKIRVSHYEQLNQIQHALSIVLAAKELQFEFPRVDYWTWHPKQTSHIDFADLTGYINGDVFLNAEITTSSKPIGTIDRHMKSTLESLSRKNGKKFYFVRTEVMKKRAITKIAKFECEIEVRCL